MLKLGRVKLVPLDISKADFIYGYHILKQNGHIKKIVLLQQSNEYEQFFVFVTNKGNQKIHKNLVYTPVFETLQGRQYRIPCRMLNVALRVVNRLLYANVIWDLRVTNLVTPYDAFFKKPLEIDDNDFIFRKLLHE